MHKELNRDNKKENYEKQIRDSLATADITCWE